VGGDRAHRVPRATHRRRRSRRRHHPPAADTHLDDLLARYSLVRRFLPTLLASLRLQAAPAGVDVLAAWEALGALEGRRSVRADEVPLTLATGPWVTRVHGPDGLLHRPAFTLLVLERLREALRRRDVYATTSRRWSDPRAQLLSGSAWEAARAGVATSLGHDLDPHRELAELAADLDGAYRAVAGRIADNAAVRIETADGHDRLVLTPLDRLDEPPSLLALRAAVDDLLPRVDLPDVLLEVAGWTGFINEFTHVSEGTARAADLGVSICAVLVAEACNIGLEPVVQPGNPALSRGRLSWADQNYLRGDTITAATGRMVDAQSEIPLARQWGGGEVASADGLRFVVPVRTLNAGPNPRYFGPGRGVTYLNFLSDQFAGFPRHRRTRHPARQPAHPRRAARAADHPAAHRADDRHGRLQRPSLRAVPAPRVPVQPPPGRHRLRPVLAHHP